MIKIENIQVAGLDAAMRGMRNPKNSWAKNDSNDMYIGPNDIKLAETLAKGGPVHAKYRRMIVVYMDITAPLYWWKEFDTYKVGTVRNSCSTMHKILDKEFTWDDFSAEKVFTAMGDNLMDDLIKHLNNLRNDYINVSKNEKPDEEELKDIWYETIQLLPSSYNQRSTIMMNYEVASNMWHYRRNHKLDEWHDFCRVIESLPYSKELICTNRGECDE